MMRIALIGENSVEYVRCLLKIWSQGDCVVLLDWRIPFPKMVEMMQEANVKICYVDEVIYQKLKNNVPTWIDVRIYNNKKGTMYIPKDCYELFCESYSESEAVVIYSSGTTGKSKGIILSHYAINKNADSILDYMKPQSGDCIYLAKSLSHSSTLIGELLVALKAQIRAVISPTIILPRMLLNNIAKYNVSIICLNPTLLRLLINEYQQNRYNLASLRCMYICGAPLTVQLYEDAKRELCDIKIYNMYGLTEAGPRVASQTDHYHTSNSVGKPIKEVEVVITDEEGNIVSEGECGIIHVNTPSKFSGYISGNTKHLSLYKGWLNTGDIGSFDMNGELYIQGRLDDVMIINAHKIYPKDIEEQLLKYSEIKECSVFAIDTKNEKMIACIYTADRELSSNNLIPFLSKYLMPYEIPHIYKRVERIPIVSNGKFDYKKMREIIKEYIE